MSEADVQRGESRVAARDPMRDAGAAPKGADVVGRHRRLVLRTALISFLTLVSRLLGFVREMLAAAMFGDRSGVYDAFITAWRVPNLFRRLLGEGAMATSFQTAMTRLDAEHGDEAGRALLWATMRALFGILLAVTVVVMVLVTLVPDTMPLTGWHWLGADPGPVRELTVRLMPFVVLTCMAALISGALQVRGVFGAPAWAPSVFNVVWIAALTAIWAAYGMQPRDASAADGARHLAMTRWLAYGVLAAAAAQLAVQWRSLRRAGLARRGRSTLPAGEDGPRRVLERAAPLAFGAAVYQVNVMIDGFMAEGLLANGGPTIHYLANRVQHFPLALVAIAATSAVFPVLQAHGHVRDLAAVRRLHDRTHLAIVFVALPASVGLAVLAYPLSDAMFGRGAFGSDGVARLGLTLQMLCLAILPAGAIGLTARVYYSLGDFRTPVRVSAWMLLANVGLNFAFLAGLGMDVEGLALSTALTSWLNVALLWPGLTRKLGLPPGEPGHAGRVARVAAASLVSGAAALGANAALAGVLGRSLGLVAAVAAGVVAYVLTAQMLGVPETRAMLAKLRSRFFQPSAVDQ